jgi:hypothetical protein
MENAPKITGLLRLWVLGDPPLRAAGAAKNDLLILLLLLLPQSAYYSIVLAAAAVSKWPSKTASDKRHSGVWVLCKSDGVI